MKTAFLYAGQGSQKTNMGRDFYEQFPQIRPIFNNKNAGFDIAELCFESPIETISQTEYTQPCMAAFAASVTTLLYEKNIRPDYTAGLSLGEYNALYASGVFSEDTLIRILAFRGRVMAESTKGTDTRMTAVLGLDAKIVEQAVKDASSSGIVACANFNCPGQIVIGGETKAVDAAVSRCNELGARRCMPLSVSGPFHTPLMEHASQRLDELFETIEFAQMQVPVIFNTVADILPAGETIPSMLVRQVKSPVLFGDSILKLKELGVETVIEIGPGNVLSGFIKKTSKDIKVYSISSAEDFEKTVSEFMQKG